MAATTNWGNASNVLLQIITAKYLETEKAAVVGDRTATLWLQHNFGDDRSNPCINQIGENWKLK